jgi:hypothetical protein
MFAGALHLRSHVRSGHLHWDDHGAVDEKCAGQDDLDCQGISAWVSTDCTELGNVRFADP